MKSLYTHSILLSLLLFIFCITKEHVFFISLCSISILWMLRVKDKSILYVMGICLLTCISFSSDSYPSFQQAKAIQVNGSYAFLESNHQKVLVYTEQPLELDAIYSCSGTFERIESNPSFYNFDFTKYCHKQGVYYSISEEQITYVKDTFSFRHMLQTMIQQVQDTNVQPLLYKVLLNIKVEDNDVSNWYFTNGFTYAGILAIIQIILKYWMYEKQRRICVCFISILLCCMYRFPLLLVQSTLFQLSYFLHIPYSKRVGMMMIIIILLYPSQMTSASFLIPAIYRYSFLFGKYKRCGCMLSILIIQSILFHVMHPIQNLIYPYLQKLYGCMYLCCILYLIFSLPLYDPLNHFLQWLFSITDHLQLYGSMIGFGLVMYCLMIWIIRHHTYFLQLSLALLLVFQYFGLFHPFAQLTIINVGQGDSIYLQTPFQQATVLIDTGKQSALKSVTSYLHAKSIHQLDALIITHPDDDHNANQQSILDTFQVKQCMTEHQHTIQIDNLTVYDLNPISNEDTNQSSLVLLTQLSNQTICLMGDADVTTESTIINQFPNLTCDILKISHHGSKNGTTDQLLDTLQPSITLNSSGKNNRYHHPSEDVLQRLLKRHIPFFDTQDSGDITIVFFPWFSLFITASFEIGML